MLRTSIPVLLTILAAGCAAQTNDEGAADTVLPVIDEVYISQGFENPEGATLAPDGGYFISSVNGPGNQKDGNGYVSLISPDGEMVKRYWGAKLDAPKGMAILNDTLYVADIDKIAMLDLETGNPAGSIRVEGAAFLNDMTTWGDAVYVSDSGTATIHKISDGTSEVWLQDEALLGGVNGLLGDGERLLVATMKTGTLFSAARDGTLTEIATGMENADGIGLVPGGGYLVSSWPGQIHYVAENGAVTTLYDVEAEEGPTQNDLTVIGDTVIVPNMRQNTVTLWKVSR
ncbi:NHL repeat-containing protein [Hyphomonas pacifica]|uniref:SMP-30/Gluconolactonase/LRE-like region domain-containing protein n=1 Tax=Hyphomonas pacifica TaxID=1280941 RepID=A0A062U2Q0_9PROT|nr:hypothetical protein [Hyphomonas pacifica]KCZ50899.1 hypothetical protein HY2_12895 [Hyphomonas pacifica]RAN33468.1 hypothetical protein HY3_13025 [Hyphomonas pacifica]